MWEGRANIFIDEIVCCYLLRIILLLLLFFGMGSIILFHYFQIFLGSWWLFFDITGVTLACLIGEDIKSLGFRILNHQCLRICNPKDSGSWILRIWNSAGKSHESRILKSSDWSLRGSGQIIFCGNCAEFWQQPTMFLLLFLATGRKKTVFSFFWSSPLCYKSHLWNISMNYDCHMVPFSTSLSTDRWSKWYSIQEEETFELSKSELK